MYNVRHSSVYSQRIIRVLRGWLFGLRILLL